MRPQAVSNQLQRLLDRGILGSRREGNSIIYRIVDPCVISPARPRAVPHRRRRRPPGGYEGQIRCQERISGTLVEEKRFRILTAFRPPLMGKRELGKGSSSPNSGEGGDGFRCLQGAKSDHVAM